MGLEMDFEVEVAVEDDGELELSLLTFELETTSFST